MQEVSNIFRTAIAMVLWVPVAQTGLAADDSRPAAKGVQFGLGAAVIAQREPYRDMDQDTDIIGIPILTIETRRFSLQGPRLAYHVADGGPVEFDVIAAWRFNGVDPDDSAFLAGMAQRKGTLDVGFNFAYRSERTVSTLRATADLLDRHGGFDVSASFGLPQRLGYLFITPSVGIDYLSSGLVEYYYGIRPEEATAARPAYAGGDALNFVLELEAVQPLTKHWTMVGGIRHEWLDSSITDSPIVDADTRTSFFAGFVRTFADPGAK